MFNFKTQYHLKRMAGCTLVAFLAFSGAAGCAWFDDQRDVLPSGIQPAPLLVPDKKKIALSTPTHNTTLGALGVGSQNFTFDSTDTAYAALYIFNATPVLDSTKSYVANMVAVCHGGATNMASHVWNDKTLRLDLTTANTQFYKCTSSSVDLLSLTQKLIYNAPDFTAATTYYWAVLGYDENYMLTHSSEVRAFTTP